jgi:V8-like Glu-specific endopeptidase
LCLFAGSSVGLAQTAPLSSFEAEVYQNTGLLQNDSAHPDVVASFMVDLPGAAWIRLHMAGTTLAEDPVYQTGATLRITSVLDGAVQTMNARHLREWSYRSAYFNGDSVLVEVIADARTGKSRVIVDGATVGVPPAPEESQCGAVDDRVLSNDPRQARLVPIGCTGWLINDCKKCFLTAGHCTGSSMQTAEFNVPLSNPNGSNNHPPPEDQYAVDFTSLQTNGGQGTGNDWGYFGVFPNSNTGLTPFEAMGDAYDISPATLPPFDSSDTIRITGYGNDFDDNEFDNVQQTHTGPWELYTGNLLRYSVDTQGGNSGSPVEHEPSGLAIGIHTHAGCSSGGNQGTALSHPALQTALSNPQGICALGVGENCSAGFTRFCFGDGTSTACPCGNAGHNGMGCQNSTGTGGVLLGATGDPLKNDVVLEGTNFRPAFTPGAVVIRSLESANPSTTFGDGLLCIGTRGFVRLAAGLAISGTATVPIGHGAGPGTFFYQLWYRSNPASWCTPDAFNLSNGLTITW